MKFSVCVILLLLICCLDRLDCSLPDFTPATARPQVEASVSSDMVSSVKNRKGLGRLPGLCRRLKRRRVTVLCNLQKFCWWGRSQNIQSGQVCRCPRGCRCSHFFIHSI